MTNIQFSGVNISASHVVSLVYETRVGASKAGGTKGEVHYEIKEMKHNPRVRLYGKWVQDPQTNMKTTQGDAVISQIHQKHYSRQDLMSADYWLIDNEVYKVINGNGVYDEDENGIFWTAVLKRPQQNEVKIEDLTKNKQP